MQTISNALLLTFVASCSLFGQNHPLDNSALQLYEAHATSVIGKVSRVRDEQPWAVSAGERVPVRQVISTGNDGIAHFTVAGGSNFDIFSNSRVVFRQNTASAGDLLDVMAGRVRVHLQPTLNQPQQRIFTPTAIITATRPATVALAIDQDDTLRIDVLEGEVKVEHARLPKTEPTEVRALDAILVRPDEPISRRVDRGSLYRYTVKSLKDIWAAVTPGHSGQHNGGVIEGDKILARMSPSPFLSSR
ncbi:MAG: FecR family protein [Acidobacteriota bacterium]|nr:FecR family protein [Acidobacteriota bacterium]